MFWDRPYRSTAKAVSIWGRFCCFCCFSRKQMTLLNTENKYGAFCWRSWLSCSQSCQSNDNLNSSQSFLEISFISLVITLFTMPSISFLQFSFWLKFFNTAFVEALFSIDFMAACWCSSLMIFNLSIPLYLTITCKNIINYRYLNTNLFNQALKLQLRYIWAGQLPLSETHS